MLLLAAFVKTSMISLVSMLFLRSTEMMDLMMRSPLVLSQQVHHKGFRQSKKERFANNICFIVNIKNGTTLFSVAHSSSSTTLSIS